MRVARIIAIVLALAPAGVAAVLSATPDSPARLWIAAVRDHEPGTVDPPLLEISGWPADRYEAVRRQLRGELKEEFREPEHRYDVIRRGVLLHTDIALLTPDRAATFTRLPGRQAADSFARPLNAAASLPPSVIIGLDGEFVTDGPVTAHWAFARMLVEALPEPSGDRFAALWYRATTARFERAHELGLALPHLQAAVKILPRDPWILFYVGAMNEAFASPRFQNVQRSRPPGPRQHSPLLPPNAQLREAATYFRRAVEVDPDFAEARLRLGRTLGLLGRHQQALAELQRAENLSADRMFRYFCQLFLGDELRALGRVDEARRAFGRAAALFPTAQAPLLARSELARRSGDPAGALQALAQLPGADPGDRVDPWWVYLKSHASNASALMDEVRAPFLRSGR